MIKSSSDRWIALSVMASSLTLIVILAIILGKWQPPHSGYKIHARFDSVSGIGLNTPVHFAGAPAGRVIGVRVLPKAERLQKEGQICYVELTLEVPCEIELGADITVEVKQDGVLGAKFVMINPGSLDAPPLGKETTLIGESPVDLMDVAAPIKKLVTQMGPILEEARPLMKNLNLISGRVNDSMPTLLERMQSVLENGDDIMKDVGSLENRKKFTLLLRDMRVVSSNLKVISTDTKALANTLGERPWRLLWGGEPNVLPTEEEILASDKPLPIKKAK